MSGSSRAAQTLSRCIVIIDAGMTISWAFNPNGSYPGTEYHRQEEEAFVHMVDVHAPELEAIIDRLETGGREFLPVDHPDFDKRSQTGSYSGFRQVFVRVAAVPELEEDELQALADRFGEILGEPSPDKSLPRSEDDLFSF